ncbi:MAG: hypothetical protein JNN25_01625 [Candidatus Kapabacteria bacterium]|nr:hypothetical protein [Candidatus Kapabacteria bacterium]
MSQLATFLSNLHSDTRSMTAYSVLQLKQAVILKVLHLLGWDAFDISKVQADHSAGGITVDYALQTPTSGMIFLHVIKPLDDSTREQQEKIVKLAGAENVRIAVLTDGVHWEMFAPAVRGTLNEKQFAKFNIHEQSADECDHLLKHYLSHRIAVSGTAFTRAEKICSERLKKKNANLSTALSDAWASVIQEFETIFVELLVVETKRLFGHEEKIETVQKFFSRFLSMTTGEISHAKRMKYDPADTSLAEAWSALSMQLDPLFVELMVMDIEKTHGFIPEKESVTAYLQTLRGLQDQAVDNAKRLKEA